MLASAAMMARPLRAGLLASALVLASCSRHKAEPAPEPVALAAAPAPAGLAAEIVVAHPSATWASLRAQVAGPLAVLPSTVPMLAGAWLGLPPAAIDLIDAERPLVGAILDGGSSWDVAVALHVRGGERFVQAATSAQSNRWTSHADPAGIVLLSPKDERDAGEAALGVSDDWLVVASRGEAIVQAGRWLSRTLAARPAPAEPIVIHAPGDALAGPVQKRLGAAWSARRRELADKDAEMRAKHDGGAPDFGDPAAALEAVEQSAIDPLLAILGDLADARLVVTPDDAGLHLAADLAPRAPAGAAGKAIGALAVGDARPLLALPASAFGALLTRDDAASREERANGRAETLAKVLGDRLSVADRERVDTALASFAKASGDWTVAGATWTRGTPRLVVRTAAADPEAASRAFGGLVHLLDVPAVARPLEPWLGPLRAVDEKPGAAGAPSVVRLVPPGKPRAKTADVAEIAWGVEAGQLVAIAGPGAKDAWSDAGAQKETLGAVPEVRAAVESLGDGVSTAIVLQVLRLAAETSGRGDAAKLPAAPIVVAWGRKDAHAWTRVELPTAFVREALKVAGSL